MSSVDHAAVEGGGKYILYALVVLRDEGFPVRVGPSKGSSVPGVEVVIVNHTASHTGCPEPIRKIRGLQLPRSSIAQRVPYVLDKSGWAQCAPLGETPNPG